MSRFPAITAGSVLGLAAAAPAALQSEDPGTVRLMPVDAVADGAPAAVVVLPGANQGVRVRRSKDIEGVAIEGRSGSVKLYYGLADAEIEIPLRLTDDRLVVAGGALSSAVPLLGGDAPAEKLRVIEGLFSRRAVGGGLLTWRITHPLVNAMGVNRVVFSGIEASSHAARDYFDFSAVFLQHEPDLATAAAQEEATPATAAPPEAADQPAPADSSVWDALCAWWD